MPHILDDSIKSFKLNSMHCENNYNINLFAYGVVSAQDKKTFNKDHKSFTILRQVSKKCNSEFPYT